MSYSKNLKKAITMLKENDYTCVLQGDNNLYSSHERGIKPLLGWLDDGISKSGFCAADKVIGKAAAFLYVLLGIKEVYANVISTAAIDVLRQYNVKVYFATETDYIINRAGNGRCPMESAVIDINDPTTALKILREKLKQINSGGSL